MGDAVVGEAERMALPTEPTTGNHEREDSAVELRGRTSPDKSDGWEIQTIRRRSMPGGDDSAESPTGETNDLSEYHSYVTARRQTGFKPPNFGYVRRRRRLDTAGPVRQ